MSRTTMVYFAGRHIGYLLSTSRGLFYLRNADSRP